MKSLSFYVHLLANRVFWAIARPIRQLYRLVARPELRGVKCVVMHEDAVLLVRINYGHRSWTFPGGGVNRGETWLAAALRETEEETGIRLLDAVFVGEYRRVDRYTQGTTQVFQATLHARQEPVADGIEIAETRWFTFDQLPANRVSRVDETIAAFVSRPPRPTR